MSKEVLTEDRWCDVPNKLSVHDCLCQRRLPTEVRLRQTFNRSRDPILDFSEIHYTINTCPIPHKVPSKQPSTFSPAMSVTDNDSVSTGRHLRAGNRNLQKLRANVQFGSPAGNKQACNRCSWRSAWSQYPVMIRLDFL